MWWGLGLKTAAHGSILAVLLVLVSESLLFVVVGKTVFMFVLCHGVVVHGHIGYQGLLYVSISVIVGPPPMGKKRLWRDRRGNCTATTSDEDFQVDVDLIVKLQAFG